jgi:hypothetical protein
MTIQIDSSEDYYSPDDIDCLNDPGSFLPLLSLFVIRQLAV